MDELYERTYTFLCALEDLVDSSVDTFLDFVCGFNMLHPAYVMTLRSQLKIMETAQQRFNDLLELKNILHCLNEGLSIDKKHFNPDGTLIPYSDTLLQAVDEWYTFILEISYESKTVVTNQIQKDLIELQLTVNNDIKEELYCDINSYKTNINKLIINEE